MGWYGMGWDGIGWDGIVDWIDLAQDRNKWQVFENATMNLQVPQLAKKLLDSHEGLCSMELVS
jgi:hypothetical protein